MKQLYKFVLVLGILPMGLLAFVIYDSQEVFWESKESKTVKGEPVFNRIQFFSEGGQDIWMMNQSHHGAGASGEKLDRLAIVVDKRQSPKRAKFYRLKPGALIWDNNATSIQMNVSCFLCHNNGPRAIRPNLESDKARLSIQDQIKIFTWNVRIKLYGRVIEDDLHREQDKTAQIPFRYRSAYENEPLQIESCTKCHRDTGLFARGILRRQQVTTIRHLVESKQMPPPGFSLAAEDAKVLQRFYRGF